MYTQFRWHGAQRAEDVVAQRTARVLLAGMLCVHACLTLSELGHYHSTADSRSCGVECVQFWGQIAERGNSVPTVPCTLANHKHAHVDRFDLRLETSIKCVSWDAAFVQKAFVQGSNVSNVYLKTCNRNIASCCHHAVLTWTAWTQGPPSQTRWAIGGRDFLYRMLRVSTVITRLCTPCENCNCLKQKVLSLKVPPLSWVRTRASSSICTADSPIDSFRVVLMNSAEVIL